MPSPPLPDDIICELLLVIRDLLRLPGQSSSGGVVTMACQVSADLYLKEHCERWTSLLYLSVICRRWRRVALSTSHLWTFIRITGTVANSYLVKKLLRHSRHAPLTLLYTTARYSQAEGLDTNSSALTLRHKMQAFTFRHLPKHASRISQLGIHGDSAFAHGILFFLRYPLPMLSELWIEHDLSTVFPGSTGVRSFATLTTPSLQILHVANLIPASWTSLTKLTTLEVLDTGTGLPLSREELVSVLRTNPHLEVLKISVSDQSAVRLFHLEPSSSERTAHLPKLTRLSLGRQVHFALSVLNSIAFPSTTVVDLRFRVDSRSMVTTESALALCYLHPLLLSLPRLHDIAAATTRGRISLLVGPSGRSTASFSAAALSVELELEVPQEEGPYPTLSAYWLAAVLELWSFSRLTALALLLSKETGPERRRRAPSAGLQAQFEMLFERFPAVEELEVCGVEPRDARALLYPLMYLRDCTDAGSMRCPNARRFFLGWTAEGCGTARTLEHFRRRRAEARCTVESLMSVVRVPAASPYSPR